MVDTWRQTSGRSWPDYAVADTWCVHAVPNIQSSDGRRFLVGFYKHLKGRTGDNSRTIPRHKSQHDLSQAWSARFRRGRHSCIQRIAFQQDLRTGNLERLFTSHKCQAGTRFNPLSAKWQLQADFQFRHLRCHTNPLLQKQLQRQGNATSRCSQAKQAGKEKQARIRNKQAQAKQTKPRAKDSKARNANTLAACYVCANGSSSNMT